ncbi:MLO-like protein 15 [Syzygium oleosum]|uniref:MLO-like protein 15 n=1 Tax=Syzygium oleosum TaxID=219896 RepID=UPI0024BA00CB|nr:MLO-like protein 15 [Syzygium oleosum]
MSYRVFLYIYKYRHAHITFISDFSTARERMAGEGEGATLEFTPTWVVAVVCTVIVVISLAVERFLHYAGKYLKKRNQKPLFDALQKIKEELMLLGFISLLLTVFQGRIGRICISEELANKWLPCKKEAPAEGEGSGTTAHFLTNFFHPGGRRLLAEGSSDYCSSEGKVPLLSLTALHNLHIFIFVLAVVHVVFCALTILCGGAQIRLWKRWEDAIQKKEYDPEEALRTKFTHVQDHTFIRGRFLGIGKSLSALSWVHSFFKQFYGSVTKSDYTTLRLGFIMAHCRGNPKFNFHKYMIRALEADFKKVVGICWYLWLFVVVFLLLNVAGWHAYFWISFIPLILLLAVGTKLEHVISQLAQEVAQRHVAIEGDLVVQPSDDHFWFHRPRLVLVLIHIILFQNSFELAFFFFVLFQYKFSSCIMGEVRYIIPRLVIGVFIQFFCSYSTLPLYAIVTQMGTSFKKAIFDEHIQEGLVGWARHAKKNKNLRKTATGGPSVQTGSKEGSVGVELIKSGGKGTATGDVEAQEIQQSPSPMSTTSETQTLMKP